jgi:hypothetical protein
MSIESIEFTYKEALALLPYLEKVSATPMPAALNWRFSKPFSLLKTELLLVEEQKQKLIFRYCQKDEKDKPIKLPGNNFQFTNENYLLFETEYEQVLKEMFLLPIKKSKISELAPYQLSLINLEKFIIDEEEKE